ncbi:MAG: ABC transporter permease [Geobacteraceae bacterium]|nr:ABC transporter permease [Geobacteraceae bacterium]
MRTLNNIMQLGVKELRSLWHDKVLLGLIVFMFTAGIYTGAASSSLELHHAPVAFVDEDCSPLSARIRQAFYEPSFSQPELISSSEAGRELDKGRYTFVIDIPPDFEHDVLAGRNPDLQVDIDATIMTQAFIGAGYINSIISNEINGHVGRASASTAAPINFVVRALFNPNLNGIWFGGIMEIMTNITLLSIILTGAALIREREHGTIEHLLVMPLTPFEIMAAKIWANGLVVLFSAAASLFLVVEGFLGVPIKGFVPLFLFGAMLYLFSTTSIGIFLGTVARSMPQFGLLIILIILPMQLLSGGMTPRESMPEIVQQFMLLSPTTYFVKFSQTILYRGGGLSVIWPQFAAITAIGAVFFTIALLRFRKSISQTQV